MEPDEREEYPKPDTPNSDAAKYADLVLPDSALPAVIGAIDKAAQFGQITGPVAAWLKEHEADLKTIVNIVKPFLVGAL
jgi:hypothetical protein